MSAKGNFCWLDIRSLLPCPPVARSAVCTSFSQPTASEPSQQPTPTAENTRLSSSFPATCKSSHGSLHTLASHGSLHALSTSSHSLPSHRSLHTISTTFYSLVYFVASPFHLYTISMVYPISSTFDGCIPIWSLLKTDSSNQTPYCKAPPTDRLYVCLVCLLPGEEPGQYLTNKLAHMAKTEETKSRRYEGPKTDETKSRRAPEQMKQRAPCDEDTCSQPHPPDK